MSSYCPEPRRVVFDYEISAGKSSLRLLKHEKDFERLYLIPSKNIEEAFIWRLCVKPEVSENMFGISGSSITPPNTNTKDAISKRHSTGGNSSNTFTFEPKSSSSSSTTINFTEALKSNVPVFSPIPLSKSMNTTNTKVLVQVTLVNISSSLKDKGLKTSIKIVFRDNPSIMVLSKCGSYTFTETNRTFEISMPTNEFDNFLKEIVVNVQVTILEMDESPLKDVNIRNLSNDLSDLYETKKYTDATLVVDDGEFQVHRGILAARSPVFFAMFDKTMKEGISGTAIIEDLDKEVLNELLYFIYSGRVKNLKEYGPGLLVASDKYNILMLKEICEEFLANNLTLEVACEELILADIHSCPTLKPKVTSFILKNALEVTKTKGWEAMIKTHPYLVAEMFEAMANLSINSTDISKENQ